MALRRPLVFLVLSLSLGACASSEKPAPEPPPADLGGATISLPRGPEMFEIATLEDRRSTGDGRLFELAQSPDPAIRARAVRAIGRLPHPDFGAVATAALAERLEDSDLDVRLEAAFGLGVRGDPGAVSLLLAYKNDPDAKVRAAVIRAVSHYDRAEVRTEVTLALRDSSSEVRCAAAEGSGRWSGDSPDADRVDRSLVDALSPKKISDTFDSNARAHGIEPELAWRLVYALSRRRALLGRGAFLEYLTSERELEQLFAARGLGRIEGDPDIVKALVAFVRDEGAIDWRARYEAVHALGVHADPSAVPVLLRAAKDKSVHVRAGALTALGAFPGEKDATLPVLRQGLIDVSANVRVAALAALTAILPPDEALQTLSRSASSDDPVVRAGVASALADVASPRALDPLVRLTEDPSVRVAGTAISSLGEHDDPRVRETLLKFLDHADNGLRLAAVLALRERPDAGDVVPLIRTFETSAGDISTEVAFNVLQNLGAIGGEQAAGFLREAAKDPRSHVRRVARAVLMRSFGEAVPALQLDREDEGPVPFPGRGFPRWRMNPVIELSTTRGPLVFELFPAEAPLHVFNFLRLLEEGHYDGLSFHRVVSDFVAQGGDYRGDGNGGKPWRGLNVRHEITPRDYVRGSLGMPRNDDKDSGGSQIFITHRPTPHLTGRYTIFGELREGFSSLDRLEVGDRILGARILDPRRGKGPPPTPDGR